MDDQSFRDHIRAKVRDKALMKQIDVLVRAIEDSDCCVVYTGAGISTNAQIPDYRGKNGVFTLKSQGEPHPGCPDLREVVPTLTHSLLREMMWDHLIAHIVSQNCDGLHLRSGIPQCRMSEIHGNSFIEWCFYCSQQYVRPFDVTYNSNKRTHRTKRNCDTCKGPLYDTIIYCNESRALAFPQNWQKISSMRDDIDVILVLGTTGKILAGYEMLFPPQAKVYIVNHGPTELDDIAELRIDEDCDTVLFIATEIMRLTRPPDYCRVCDPVVGTVKAANNFWNDCCCGRRPSRNLAGQLFIAPLPDLRSHHLPSWMIVPLTSQRKPAKPKKLAIQAPPPKAKVIGKPKNNNKAGSSSRQNNGCK